MVSNKSRLLRLYKYLYTNTDSEHFTTKGEIMEALRDEETVYSRQTVRNDIDTLTEEGYDIETVVSSGNYYYFREREFTLEELRIIADAVTSSRFVGKNQKARIRKKLKQFCSRYQAGSVERHLICLEQPNKRDFAVYDMVNLLNDAVNRGRRISFQLLDRPARSQEEPASDRGLVLAEGGTAYICTPLDLVWDGKKYYLVGLEDPDRTPVLYAVEDLVRPVILDLEAAEKPKEFNPELFAKKILEPEDLHMEGEK